MVNKIAWDDLQNIAEEAFHIWTDHSNELAFAKEAWEILSEQHLTTFSNEIEKCKIIFRFFALAQIYHGFCNEAFEEDSECEFGWWADAIKLDKFIVGRCYTQIDSDEDNVEFDEAIISLVENEIDTVYNGLIKGYKSVSALFLALYKTGYIRNSDDEFEEYEQENLNDVTGQKLSAFNWLEQGCKM